MSLACAHGIIMAHKAVVWMSMIKFKNNVNVSKCVRGIVIHSIKHFATISFSTCTQPLLVRVYVQVRPFSCQVCFHKSQLLSGKFAPILCISINKTPDQQVTPATVVLEAVVSTTWYAGIRLIPTGKGQWFAYTQWFSLHDTPVYVLYLLDYFPQISTSCACIHNNIILWQLSHID